jgi:predicted dithiol-disulfide oxidoreductase (DUF899 family)
MFSRRSPAESILAICSKGAANCWSIISCWDRAGTQAAPAVPSCDYVDGALPHLNHHDVTWVAVSRAPLGEIESYKRRMGWKFPWVSSSGFNFNFDFHVSFLKQDRAQGRTEYNYTNVPQRPDAEAGDLELPGLSAFYKDESGEVFHTYSSYARGPEQIIGTLMILDRAPLGRNESGTMNFVRRHDEYDQPVKAAE